jgi:hypothetical protein
VAFIDFEKAFDIAKSLGIIKERYTVIFGKNHTKPLCTQQFNFTQKLKEVKI